MDSERDPKSPSDTDSLLRAVAAAPERKPNVVPERIAHFRILGTVGHGGMGIVYRAEDERLRRTVALKVLPDAFAQDEERRRRFQREARSAAALTHANIATIFDVGEDAGRIYISMELVEGQGLRERIAQGRVPPGETVRIARGIVRGLARAHAKGVVHRDLKPENVVLDADGEPKILDFGLAKLREAEASQGKSALERAATESVVTEEGRTLGTPPYMSPEQARGDAVDARSDLFSLGIVLYEMLTGRTPFGGASSAEVLAAILRDTPEPLAKAAPGVSRELAAIAERCLEKEPKGRWSGARELLEALDALPTSGSVKSVPGVSPARLGRRGPLLWIAVAMVAVLGGGAALVALRGEGAKPAGSAAGTSAPAIVSSTGSLAPLACPPLRATGVPEPPGWLGAGAAEMVCRRAVTLLGGSARALVPAELLDLARLPTDKSPTDPFAGEDVRARATAAAKTRALRYLDGEVAREQDGFRVTLVVRSPDDRELGRAKGRGAELFQAVREAMQPLLRPDVLPRAASMDPALAAWTGVSDVEVAMAVEDWRLSQETGLAAMKEERERLKPHRAELGAVWAVVATEECYPDCPEDIVAEATVPVERSSPAALARTAPVHARFAPAEALGLADEVASQAAKEDSALGRRFLSQAEIGLRSIGGDGERVRQMTLAAVQDTPTDYDLWAALESSTYGHRGWGAVARAEVAWVADRADALDDVGCCDPLLDVPTRLLFLRRAYALSPRHAVFAVNLGGLLLAAGDREEARALGGRMLAEGGDLGAMGEGLMTRVDASEALFGAALARGQRMLSSVPRVGAQAGIGETTRTMWVMEQVATITDRSRELADELVRRFVDPEPSRLSRDPYAFGVFVQACAHASPDPARRCFARLRRMLAEHYFLGVEGLVPPPYVDGCERFAQGDWKGAAVLWRPLLEGSGSVVRWLQAVAPIALDASGDTDLAERLDAQSIAQDLGDYHGASMAHVRSARRAAARGDRDTARKLARQVVDAWSVADVPVPAVAEMRALLAKLR